MGDRRSVTLSFVLAAARVHISSSLDNGLALTPPMGWSSAERFQCQTDCKAYPDSCVSEQLYMAMADRLAQDGWRDVGYTYVNIDDCWSAEERDSAAGRQVPDPQRFPSGVKALADYVHARGLKLGLYTDVGAHTCEGYPGMRDHIELDVQTFADWGIDLLKVGGCSVDVADFNATYAEVGRALNKTGRPIVYSCSLPAHSGDQITYDQVMQSCNVFRSYPDVEDTWVSVSDIISHWEMAGPRAVAAAVGPGSYSDPDMLVIGNFGLSREQERAQFALWAIFAAPLFMSNDLRNLPESSRIILMNREIIEVNQDPLSKQGIKSWDDATGNTSAIFQVWKKDLSTGDVAVVVRSLATQGSGSSFVFKPSMINWPANESFKAKDLFRHEYVDTLKKSVTALVRPGGVQMFRLSKQA